MNVTILTMLYLSIRAVELNDVVATLAFEVLYCQNTTEIPEELAECYNANFTLISAMHTIKN